MNFRPRGRRTGHEGKGLEGLVIASQQGVTFEKVPSGARFVRGGSIVKTASPCDFFGTLHGTGRSIVFDAKECGGASFDASPSHLAEHQRLRIVRHGEAGAVAGVLALATREDGLYWLDWRQLLRRLNSYPWEELSYVGSAKMAIDWTRLLRSTE